MTNDCRTTSVEADDLFKYSSAVFMYLAALSMHVPAKSARSSVMAVPVFAQRWRRKRSTNDFTSRVVSENDRQLRWLQLLYSLVQ